MSESAVASEPGLGVTLSEIYRLFKLTVRCCLEGGLERGAVLRQMYEIGNRSLVFLCIVMAFMGMILTYQAGLQTQRVVPDLSLLGATFLELLVRDLARRSARSCSRPVSAPVSPPRSARWS